MNFNHLPYDLKVDKYVKKLKIEARILEDIISNTIIYNIDKLNENLLFNHKGMISNILDLVKSLNSSIDTKDFTYSIECMNLIRDIINKVEKYSFDEDTRESGGELDEPLVKGDASVLGAVQGLYDKLSKLSDGEYLPEVVKSNEGFHVVKVLSRQRERQKKFEEVQQELFRELRASKEAEVKAALFRSLTEKYDVVVHKRHFQMDEGEEKK